MPFSLLKTQSFNEELKPWKVLIVDDEEDIHTITKMALKRFELEGRHLVFFSAHNSQEAKNILSETDDIALVFLDVVMETDDAGLNLAHWIRKELDNQFVRIVLRTGQPGQAPEEEVIMRYDINDYKQKTELDRTKLFTSVVTALRAYRDLVKIETSHKYEKLYRTGLQSVISSTADIMEKKTLKQFFDGILQQVVSLMHIEEEGLFVRAYKGAGTICNKDDYKIIAHYGGVGEGEIDQHIIKLLDRARRERKSLFEQDTYIAYFPSESKEDSLLYLKGVKSLTDINIQLLNVFSNSIGIAFDNLLLNREIIQTQEELISRLGDAVESRSKESGNHIRRIAEFSELLAKKFGLDEVECEVLKQASPMHDVGKIATPDQILLKPGKLTEQEMEIMRQHTLIGYDILKGSERPILKAAAIISQQHHEKYNGSGYPREMVGEEIHVYARIVALADVFDALLHRRCYKGAWPIDDVIRLIESEKGKHFDPKLVDILVNNLDQFIDINNALTLSDEL
ncbi:DUF3369 domain-containing protein [Aliiglaciecola sp.]|nr:DUF3369 domain-containing protein [Aliiglaciecola sp.]